MQPTFSRPRVAFNLATIPFTAISAMFRAASSAVAITWGDIKSTVVSEFRLGVRYVLTGLTHPEAIAEQRQALVAGTKAKAASTVDRFKAFAERHLKHRAAGLAFFLAIPFLLLYVLVEEAIYRAICSDLFSDIILSYRDAIRAIVTGKPLDL